jgi:hypothetical protein
MDSALPTPSRAALSKDETQGELAIPILLVVFNRPDTTQTVFRSIRSARPRQLFVAADGPRPTVDGEKEKCDEARRLATQADWPCAVTTAFRERNAGLASSMSAAITWFFENVSAGIILEDDCVPSSSFYRFCAELLGFYETNPTVMHISGDNFQYGRVRGGGSYYFSRYAHCWGWATWRRAWQRFRFQQGAPDGPPTVWAKHWELSIQQHHGVSVLPNANLVTNIGFGAGATHTATLERYSFLPAQEIEFPLVHPAVVKVNTEADEFTYYSHFRNVRHLDFVWFYRIWDRIYISLKRAKRFIWKTIVK